jgi:hypothetical protein
MTVVFMVACRCVATSSLRIGPKVSLVSLQRMLVIPKPRHGTAAMRKTFLYVSSFG